MTLPIRARLTIWYTGVLAAILLAGGIFLVLRLQVELMKRVDQNLSLAASEISVDYRSGRGESEFRDVTDTSLAGLPRADSAAQILSSQGALVETAGGRVGTRAMANRTVVASVLRGNRVYETVRVGAAGDPLRLLAVPFQGVGGRQVLVLGTSLDEVERAVRHLLLLLALFGPVALAAAALAGWGIARKALRPVSDITRRAAEIGSGPASDRIPLPRSSDELRRLAVTLNGMLERVQASTERERRFIEDAAHELRTPLGIMRSELDVSLRSDQLPTEARETLESSREEVERLSLLVENLLTLAQIDEGRLEVLREPIELREVAKTVAERMAPAASGRNVSIDVRGVAGPVLADRVRIEQVVTNLLANAVKYSPSHGVVTLRVWETKTEVGLDVTDSGPGIPADALPHVFERFYRVDRSRSAAGGGSGIGLAICRQVVQAFGGRVWAESEVGRGSTFSLAIPASAGGA